jgi:hypothetical protein
MKLSARQEEVGCPGHVMVSKMRIVIVIGIAA